MGLEPAAFHIAGFRSYGLSYRQLSLYVLTFLKQFFAAFEEVDRLDKAFIDRNLSGLAIIIFTRDQQRRLLPTRRAFFREELCGFGKAAI